MLRIGNENVARRVGCRSLESRQGPKTSWAADWLEPELQKGTLGLSTSPTVTVILGT